MFIITTLIFPSLSCKNSNTEILLINIATKITVQTLIRYTFIFLLPSVKAEKPDKRHSRNVWYAFVIIRKVHWTFPGDF